MSDPPIRKPGDRERFFYERKAKRTSKQMLLKRFSKRTSLNFLDSVAESLHGVKMGGSPGMAKGLSTHSYRMNFGCMCFPFRFGLTCG